MHKHHFRRILALILVLSLALSFCAGCKSCKDEPKPVDPQPQRPVDPVTPDDPVDPVDPVDPETLAARIIEFLKEQSGIGVVSDLKIGDLSIKIGEDVITATVAPQKSCIYVDDEGMLTGEAGFSLLITDESRRYVTDGTVAVDLSVLIDDNVIYLRETQNDAVAQLPIIDGLTRIDFVALLGALIPDSAREAIASVSEKMPGAQESAEKARWILSDGIALLGDLASTEQYRLMIFSLLESVFVVDLSSFTVGVSIEKLHNFNEMLAHHSVKDAVTEVLGGNYEKLFNDFTSALSCRPTQLVRYLTLCGFQEEHVLQTLADYLATKGIYDAPRDYLAEQAKTYRSVAAMIGLDGYDDDKLNTLFLNNSVYDLLESSTKKSADEVYQLVADYIDRFTNDEGDSRVELQAVLQGDFSLNVRFDDVTLAFKDTEIRFSLDFSIAQRLDEVVTDFSLAETVDSLAVLDPAGTYRTHTGEAVKLRVENDAVVGFSYTLPDRTVVSVKVEDILGIGSYGDTTVVLVGSDYHILEKVVPAE